MANVNITITWFNGHPIGFWIGDKLIWEESDIIVTDLNPISISFDLPLIEAVAFSGIFTRGIAGTKIQKLINMLTVKIYELKMMQEKLSQTEKYKGCNAGCEDCEDFLATSCNHDCETCEDFVDCEEFDDTIFDEDYENDEDED